jgi:hypothetical protein
MDKRCSKCDELKPSTEYYTYFHKPQCKWRTRNVCNTCFKGQKKKYKETIKEQKIIEPVPVSVSPTPIPVIIPTPTVNPLALDPMYQKCRTCQEYVHYDGYYHHNSNKSYLDCKECCNKKETDRKRIERIEYLEENGGSERVPRMVGVFVDEYQKEQTYMVMEVLGYKYDEGCGHFLKLGVKEWVNGKLVFPKVGKRKYRTPKRIDYTNPVWNEIYELYETGLWSYNDLKNKFGFNTTSICQYVNKKTKGLF